MTMLTLTSQQHEKEICTAIIKVCNYYAVDDQTALARVTTNLGIDVPVAMHIETQEPLGQQELYQAIITNSNFAPCIETIICPICSVETLCGDSADVHKRFFICPNISCSTNRSISELLSRICPTIHGDLNELLFSNPTLYELSLVEFFVAIHNAIKVKNDWAVYNIRILQELMKSICDISLTQFVETCTAMPLHLPEDLINTVLNDSLSHAYFAMIGDVDIDMSQWDPIAIRLLTSILTANLQLIQLIIGYRMIYR